MTATEPKRTVWSPGRGESVWVLGKCSAPEGGGHGHDMLELKEHLDGQCCQTYGLDFGWCCVEPGSLPTRYSVIQLH